ncbi:ABC transporter ATP-binding protein [Castellaniella defragrans]|uniref:Branched-chain amino acid transport system ATP-binding protein n=1 Tax=Castellaniella defragrans TaxID=75697 RepID=A0A7W9TS56_CASDE|nr:ABC transporter ATP-binding protein [Castellaniella defragrans]KAB0620570.1 ABC transporter ATP-binding protein [Castellaniella defragrans]MBB6085411.1 branched-chain amino acid transport system ATP-binding protein [Castellaniella defragrans]
MKNLLEVSDLKARYDRSQVLHGIDFSVAPGEVVTLLGRNGMGKSTTLKCVMGMLSTHVGEIRLEGRQISGLPSYEVARQGLGLVPEGRQIFPMLTVEENLLATAANRHQSAQPYDLDRVYEFFPRLKERRGNMGNQLSGGEQQMLAIGRALMTNPRLLILDEATEGLAPLVRADIWRVLGELSRGGMSMIVVDKNLGPLLDLAQRHFIIEKGRVVWSGDSAALRRDGEVVEHYLGV